MSQRRMPGGRGAGRPPSGGGTGTNAGARGALLLGVAVILGIVLLQQFDSDIDTGGSVAANTVPTLETTSTTRRVGLTTVPVVPTTAARTRPKGEVKVVVANGAGVRGLAGLTTDALKGLGYATLTPTDATTGTVDKTSIQFVEGYEAEARELATSLSQPGTVVTRLSAPPVAAAALEGANVVVVLGVDAATSGTTAPGATTTTTRRA